MFLNTGKKIFTRTVSWAGLLTWSLALCDDLGVTSLCCHRKRRQTKDRKCGWAGPPPGPGSSRLGGAESGLPPEFAWCVGRSLSVQNLRLFPVDHVIINGHIIGERALVELSFRKFSFRAREGLLGYRVNVLFVIAQCQWSSEQSSSWNCLGKYILAVFKNIMDKKCWS